VWRLVHCETLSPELCVVVIVPLVMPVVLIAFAIVIASPWIVVVGIHATPD
jgi:hypothetical protein